MSFDNPHNPYASPSNFNNPTPGGGPDKPTPSGMIMAPGIALIVTGVLGVFLDLATAIYAIVGPEPIIDPNADEFTRSIQEGGHGPTAAVIQLAFAVVSAVVILGGVQMARKQSWVLCLVASILAMVNCGNCCLVLGLPVGIWSIVVLSTSKDDFDN